MPSCMHCHLPIISLGVYTDSHTYTSRISCRNRTPSVFFFPDGKPVYRRALTGWHHSFYRSNRRRYQTFRKDGDTFGGPDRGTTFGHNTWTKRVGCPPNGCRCPFCTDGAMRPICDATYSAPALSGTYLNVLGLSRSL